MTELLPPWPLFSAFLPQFLAPGATPMLQGLALGALFVAIAAGTDSVYAVAALAESRAGR